MSRITVEANEVLKTLKNVFKVDVVKLDNFVALMVAEGDVAAIAIYRDKNLEVHKPETTDELWDLYHKTIKELKSVKKITLDEALKNPANMGCCGVYAVAFALDMDFGKVFNDFRTHFNRRQSWRGATNRYERLGMLTNYGANVKNVPFQKMSLRNWVKYHTKKDVKYIVTTTGHVQVVLNGVVTDQRGSVNLSDYHGARKMVNNILEIV